MKRLIIPLSILLLANTISLRAQINGKRWFAGISAGGGNSSGTLEMNRFYDPAFSLAFDLGYMLTRHISVVPVSVDCHAYRFEKKAYLENYRDNLHRDFQRMLTEYLRDPYLYGSQYSISINHISVTDFDAASSLWGVSFTPGFAFFSPTIAGFRGFGQVGAGIYYTGGYMDISYSFADKWDLKGTRVTRSKQRNLNFAMLLSSGVEYDFTETAALTIKLRYNLVQTFKNKAITKIGTTDGQRFYYLTEKGLLFNRFLEEKNTRIVEFTGGLRLYF